MLVLARLALGLLRIWRLSESSDPIKQGAWLTLAQGLAKRLRVRSGVELRKSEQVTVPMTWGAWRARVLLPAGADEWPQECRRIVLLQ